MNVVIYARFSSHNQNEQSIEGQLKACYDYAQKNDYNVICEYVDRAISGTTDNRPEFQRMIDDSNKKLFEYVLVYQLDRFARNRYDSATYKAKLKKNGIRVLSVRENISDDASGILVEGLLESMAEYYSAELSQKIRRGMDLNAQKCLSTGGNIPLGYKINKEKHFIVDHNSALTIKKIFESYSEGISASEIIAQLNAQGIKTSKGNAFNKGSFDVMLKNKKYIGIYTYKDTEIKDGVPRIIDDELFYKVQKMIEKKQKAPSRAKAIEEYLLTTKLFCGECKSAMTGVSGTSRNGCKHFYYQCVNNRKKLGCKKKTVQKEYIENLVVEETRKLLTDEIINKIAREVVNLCEREKDSTPLKRLQKLLKDNEKAITNLTKALSDGRVTDIIYTEIEKRQSENKELEKQIVIEKANHPFLTIDQVKFFINRFKNGNINDISYRKSLIDTFINKIYLYDNKMTILYNVQDSQSDFSLDEFGSPKTGMAKVLPIDKMHPLKSNR